MYFPNAIEDICYLPDHIQKILNEINITFPYYFKKFIDTSGGTVADDDAIIKLAEKFGNVNTPKKAKIDVGQRLGEIANEKVNDFYRDREKYLKLLNLEALEEHEDDPSYFKKTILRYQCPIIHHTMENKQAKELDKYREKFNYADPGEMLRVVKSIVKFANNYEKTVYNDALFEDTATVGDLQLSDLQEDEYIVYGVIGGGIKSHFLYKLNPAIFSNRSREAVWALWYLTAKKAFDCKEDSEFLMIDTEKVTTQQNYFYPYDLFSFYALHIYNLIKKVSSPKLLPTLAVHRFVIVDAFLSYVSNLNIAEITLLKQQLKEGSNGY